MEGAFLNAARPPVFKCLGRNLEPLTIGHLFLLARHAPAFLDESPTKLKLVAQLVNAVFVCSHSQSSVDRKINSPFAGARASWWAFKFRMKLELRNWACRKEEAISIFDSIAIQISNFEIYLRESITPPIVSRKSNSKTALNSPLHWILASAVMSETSHTFDQVMDWTVVNAQCFLATMAERRGDIEVVSDERLKSIREMIAMQRELDGKQGGVYGA